MDDARKTATTTPTTRTLAAGASAPTPAGGDGGGGSFGRILIELGLLTDEQLGRALETQRERSRRGDFARLGHILVEMGFLTPSQVQEVLRAQQITILACEACASQFNVRGYDEQLRYECPKCHAHLRPAQALKNVAVQDQLQASSVGMDDTVRLLRTDETHTARIRQLKLLGRYEILGEIARGGMGIIYKARQLDLDRTVALKTLRQEELSKPDAAARFRGEAQAVARLRHPHIVAVHEVGSFGGIEYFTMEFVEGLPLDRRILRDPGLTPRQAVEIVLPICEALEYAHSKGVIHRDLKPANIIIDTEGMPFLVDWGIAKRLETPPASEDGDAPPAPRASAVPVPDEEEDLLGSIPYMAPEYVEGSAYDELCDLYSLGVVLYEVLGGPNCLPYYDPDTRKFLERIMQEPPRPILSRAPDLDPELAGIVDKMIAPRARRYRSMREVVVDLRRWLLVDGRATAPTARADRPHASPWPGTLLLGALLVSSSGLALTAWSLQDARAELARARLALGQHEQTQAQELVALHLREALALERLGEQEAAVVVCTRAIDRFGQSGLKELAQVYQLRARLRRALGDAGAGEDELAARRLLGS